MNFEWFYASQGNQNHQCIYRLVWAFLFSPGDINNFFFGLHLFPLICHLNCFLRNKYRCYFAGLANHHRVRICSAAFWTSFHGSFLSFLRHIFPLGHRLNVYFWQIPSAPYPPYQERIPSPPQAIQIPVPLQSVQVVPQMLPFIVSSTPSPPQTKHFPVSLQRLHGRPVLLPVPHS